jgi:hypothetical protein
VHDAPPPKKSQEFADAKNPLYLVFKKRTALAAAMIEKAARIVVDAGQSERLEYF